MFLYFKIGVFLEERPESGTKKTPKLLQRWEEQAILHGKKLDIKVIFCVTPGQKIREIK